MLHTDLFSQSAIRVKLNVRYFKTAISMLKHCWGPTLLVVVRVEICSIYLLVFVEIHIYFEFRSCDRIRGTLHY